LAALPPGRLAGLAASAALLFATLELLKFAWRRRLVT